MSNREAAREYYWGQIELTGGQMSGCHYSIEANWATDAIMNEIPQTYPNPGALFRYVACQLLLAGEPEHTAVVQLCSCGLSLDECPYIRGEEVH